MLDASQPPVEQEPEEGELFFKCYLLPKHGRLPRNGTYKAGPGIHKYLRLYTCMYIFNHFLPDDLLRKLVFFNTFEELNLPIKGPMARAGPGGRWGGQAVRTIPNPVSVRGSSGEHGGKSPLMPLFLAGNATPTIPHLYSKSKDSGFPMGCADAASVDGRRGSNVYEVNPWLWQFGRGKPRLGGLSGEATEERRHAHRHESRAHGVETRQLRKEDSWRNANDSK